MVPRYILSGCRCEIDDLYKRNIYFNYLSDSVVFNDNHDLRNNCTCRSGKAHSFGYFYCCRHNELLIKFKTVSKFFFHRPRVACNECLIFTTCIIRKTLLRFAYLP